MDTDKVFISNHQNLIDPSTFERYWRTEKEKIRANEAKLQQLRAFLLQHGV